MTDILIIAALVVLVIAGILAGRKHFRGQGGCCGGSGYKARRKKLEHVVAKRTFVVEGMHCQHCVNRVMEAVNDMDGASAVVRLNRGEVVVSMARPLDDAQIRAAIEKAGYCVREVRDGSL